MLKGSDNCEGVVIERTGELMQIIESLRNQLKEHEEKEKALLAADRRKDEFLAIVSHELKTPLTRMVLALQVIQQGDNDSAIFQHAHNIVTRQVSFMSRMVNDLLDLARVTRDELPLNKECIELSTLIMDALETCRPLFNSCGHEIVLHLYPKPLYLDVDPVRLMQILINLLSNAARYSYPNGRIELTAGPSHKNVVICVRDYGLGIAPQLLERIFDMFTRGDHQAVISRDGMGVGLYLTKRFVELHDGHIQAFSDGPGCGSKFIVSMPILCREEFVCQDPQPSVWSKPINGPSDSAIACDTGYTQN
jgi:signal transduction histidine kinase